MSTEAYEPGGQLPMTETDEKGNTVGADGAEALRQAGGDDGSHQALQHVGLEPAENQDGSQDNGSDQDAE